MPRTRKVTIPPISETLAIAFDGAGREVADVKNMLVGFKGFRLRCNNYPGDYESGVEETPSGPVGYFFTNGFDTHAAQVFRNMAQKLLRTIDIPVLHVDITSGESHFTDERVEAIRERIVTSALVMQRSIESQFKAS